MKKMNLTLLLIISFSVASYSQDTTASNNKGKFFLSGVVGVPLIFKGIEISFDANYMFTKKWGISLGYYGGFYDSTGSDLSDFVEDSHSIFLQVLRHINLIENLDIYGGLGVRYNTTTYRKFLFSERETKSMILPYLQLGLQYWFSKTIGIKLSLLPLVGGGINIAL